MESKKTYIQPEVKVVWLGLLENVLDNIGGHDIHSIGQGTPPTEGWAKGEVNWSNGSEDTDMPTSPDLWADEW